MLHATATTFPSQIENGAGPLSCKIFEELCSATLTLGHYSVERKCDFLDENLIFRFCSISQPKALSGITNLYNKVKCTSQNLNIRCSKAKPAPESTSVGGPRLNLCKRRHVGLLLGLSCLVINSHEIQAAGLRAEEKPKLCDDACEKELENVDNVQIIA